MIVIEIERERLIYFSTNRDDSHRYRYKEAVPSINEYDSYRVRYREVVPSINQ